MGNITTKQIDESEKVNTFENVWAALAKLEKTVENTSKTVENTSKTVENTSKVVENTSKVVENTSKVVENTSKTVADLSKNIGGLGNLQGRLTEAMFEADLWKKFSEIGFPFNKQSSHYKFVENGRVLAEADFFLENGEYAMPVEIKTELSINDIDEHIERIVTIRGYMDARKDARKLAGAIAGEIAAENVLRYAHKKGLYVLKQTGESIAIAATPHNFKRQEW